MDDARFKGRQHFNFEMEMDSDDGERLFGGEANAGVVSFQIFERIPLKGYLIGGCLSGQENCIFTSTVEVEICVVCQ